MPTPNEELARNGFEAFRRGDLAEIADLLDDDVKWHFGDPTAKGACQNRAQALRWMGRADRGDPGELVDVIDAGDRIVLIIQPPPANGVPVSPRGQITTIRNGKVVEMVGYPTVDDALAAAGVTR